MSKKNTFVGTILAVFILLTSVAWGADTINEISIQEEDDKLTVAISGTYGDSCDRSPVVITSSIEEAVIISIFTTPPDETCEDIEAPFEISASADKPEKDNFMVHVLLYQGQPGTDEEVVLSDSYSYAGESDDDSIESVIYCVEGEICVGTNEDDIIYGTPGSDQIFGGNGNDTIYGYEGDDQIYGENGNDVITGGLGNDILDGGNGVDQLYSEGDYDVDQSIDVIYGDNGSDKIYNDEFDYILDSRGNDEVSCTQSQISQLYVAIFGRASEGEGNAYWFNNKFDMITAAEAMLNTEDAKNYFGDTLEDNLSFIEHIYQNTLGKTYSEDPDGIQYWVNELSNGKSKAIIVVALINALMDPAYNGTPAQKQFINKVLISDYCAKNILKYYGTIDFESLLENVTEDTSTVESAKDLVDSYN